MRCTHESGPLRLEQDAPVADAQAVAGGEVHQSFQVAGHVVTKQLQLLLDSTRDVRGEPLDVPKRPGSKLDRVPHEPPECTERRVMRRYSNGMLALAWEVQRLR